MRQPLKTRLHPGKSKPKTRSQPGSEDPKQLLRWAIRHIQLDVELLTRSFSTPSGSIDDGGAEREIRDCKNWLRKARAAVK